MVKIFTTSQMPLSQKTKWEIVFLATHHLGPKMGPSQIAKEVRCDASTVRYWIRRYQEVGDVEEAPRSGRPRKTTEEQDETILELLEENREAVVKDIHSKAKKRRIQVSPSTVRRRLVEAGMEYGTPMVKPLLTDQHRQRRLAWAQTHLNVNWDEVLFTDESSIKIYYTRRGMWKRRGELIARRSVKYPAKLHIWGCMSSKGFGKCYVFSQNLNAELLTTIYKKALLPSADRLFDGDWVLQEDNDPKHKSKKAVKWREENEVDRMEWPAQSPDQNCIENVWRILKIKVGVRKPGNIHELAKVIKQEWRKLPADLATNLVQSMPNRLHALIAADGDYTLY